MNFSKNNFFLLLEKLAKTPGESLNESKRVEVIKNFLTTNSISFKTDPAQNIIIHANPGEKEKTIIFDAHTDVAGKGYAETFTIDDKITRGRGCADDLCAVTMLMLAALELKNYKLKKPFTILLSTGEEGKGNLNGIKTFIKDFKVAPEKFIAFDLSYNTVSVSGLGSKRFTAEIFTKGGHSYEDRENPNAVEIMCELLFKIKEQLNLAEFKNRPSFNAGKISGGSEINLIADYAFSCFEFRSVSPDDLARTEKIVNKTTDKLKAKDIKILIKDYGSRPAAEEKSGTKILNNILPVFRKNKIEPEIKPMSTNINAALAAGWPSLCAGLCDCGSFHTENEYIINDSLEKGWDILVGLIKEFGII
jgi:acetylornithine deacetylase/succinyl-diaminopimelate desuccinylase-like protein